MSLRIPLLVSLLCGTVPAMSAWASRTAPVRATSARPEVREPRAPSGVHAHAKPGRGRAAGVRDRDWKPLSEQEWRERWRQDPADPVAEEEPVDPDPFGFSVYRGRRPEPMGSQSLINGARMEIASLIVEEPPQVVARFYLEALREAGVSPVLRGQVPEAPGMTYLSFRPDRSRNLKTLTLVPHGRGTVILASVGNPEEMLAGRPAVPEDFPLPPHVELPTAIQQREPGRASHSTFFLVRDSTVPAVRAFYRRELARRGFSPVPSHEGVPGMENHQRGDTVVSLSIQPHADPSAVAVGVVWLDS